MTFRGQLVHPIVPPVTSFYGAIHLEKKPRTADELKDAVRHEIAELPQETMRRVIRNFRVRLQSRSDNDGHHLRDIIFKRVNIY